jgi:carboxyl-terminal processing protease
MIKKSKKIVLVVSLLLTSIFSVGFVDNYFEISKNIDIFTTLYKELNIFYVDETDPGELMKKAIDSMLESLDPYTTYIPESEMEDFRFMTTGQYGGIGAIISKRGDYVMISEPYEGFPANKAGLIAGDKLLEINGKSVKGKSTEDVSKVLKGQPNTTVNVLIERIGKDSPFEVELKREEIKVKSVPYSTVLEGNIGYIKMTSFTRNVSNEVAEAFKEISEGIELNGLIFDLRGNPGGLLNEAVNTTNLFIEKGQEVVSTKGKVKDWDKIYNTLNDPLDKEIPLAVLINSRSASASEIVSGAIQDLDRGVVVGQRSFGKGLVQQTRKLSYNSQLKVTIAKYYIPSGRCIQALDYSDRNEDGSVGSISDSLKTEFKTLNGRSVWDGGGVNPDVVLEPRKYSNILASIMSKRHIFDFANDFYREHSSITTPSNFEINDSLYLVFTNYLNGKDYDYETRTEKAITKLLKDAEKEKYSEDLQEEIDALGKKMKASKTNDIERFKDQISQVIESEIVTRYYFQNGRIEASLKHDDEVNKAVEILKDSDTYKSILNGTYQQ